ncbi:hypothetical protein CPB85DRAFT_1252749 [Mucidula mucida]|nr:hypothetical protein CPB85DRAFT_1252749 [Mucidula mucida]
MPPKEPNRHQLSSRLSYSQETPAFLQKLKNRIAGIPDEDEDDEFEMMARVARPFHPGSDDEDNADEKPQVVVLREGKHLTEREAENIRRKEKVYRLARPEAPPTDIPVKEKKDKPNPSLSFSSSSAKPPPKRTVKKKKNTKKNSTLLSFGDDA